MPLQINGVPTNIDHFVLLSSEQQLLILQAWIDFNTLRNIKLAQRLLDYDEGNFPVIFRYENCFKKDLIRKITFEEFKKIVSWVCFNSRDIRDNCSLQNILLFMNGQEEDTYKYWKMGYDGDLIKEAIKGAAEAYRDLAVSGQKLNLEINLR